MTGSDHLHEPIRIERLLEARQVEVQWDDGRCDQFPFDVLRGYCPCAGCQGHMVRTVRYQPPKRPVTVEGIEAVGNYAVSLRFSDGHATGIYRFDFLRQLGDRSQSQEPLASELAP